MSVSVSMPTTTHRVRWGEHVDLVRAWQKQRPPHPKNPRYKATEFRIEGRYSLFEQVVNIFRERGWLDPPPPVYKWAVVVVAYRAEDDPMNEFAEI